MSIEDLERLLELQKMDSECDSITYKISLIRNHKILNELELKLSTLTLKREKLDQTIHSQGVSIAVIESKGEAIRLKIAALNDKLYHQRDLDSKDLQIVASEVKHQQKLLDEVDDEELILLEKNGEVEAALKEIECEESHILAEMENLKTELRIEIDDLTEQLDRFKGLKQEIRESIGKEYLDTYDKLRSTGKQVAIGRLVDNKCTGCSVDIATAEINKIAVSGDSINYCEQCGCIIII